jgi:hypothetical protein
VTAKISRRPGLGFVAQQSEICRAKMRINFLIVLRKGNFHHQTMAPSAIQHQVNGFVLDDKGDLDFSDLEKKYEVSFEEGFDNVILVDNCPIVADDARKQKLIAFLRRIFSTNGTIKEDGIYMPMGENPETGKVESRGYS